MAEQSKFAGALGRLNKRPEEADAVDIPPVPIKVEQQPKTAELNGRGGKRSNPEFSATTFFVRKDTKRKASRLLEDTNAGKDLSDLVEELLSKWVSKRTNA